MAMQEDRRAAYGREADHRQALFAQVASIGAAREDLRRDGLAFDALSKRVPYAFRQALRTSRAEIRNYRAHVLHNVQLHSTQHCIGSVHT